MRGKNSRIRTKVPIIVSLILFQISIGVLIQAQGTIDLRQKARLVTTDIQEIHVGWGEDSNFLYYTSSTGQSIVDTYSLLPVTPPSARNLSPDVLSHFGIDRTDLDHPKAYYSVSPDGQYVIYTVITDPYTDNYMDNPYCGERHLRLGYIPDGTFIELGFKTQLALNFEWVGRGSGIIISDGYYGHGCAVYGEPALTAYITGFTLNLTSTRMIALDRSDSEYFHTIYQSSIDGRFLLIGGYHFLEAVGNPTLELFDTQEMENSSVVAEGRDETPIVAWFSPNDLSKVMGISRIGLVEIDIHTQNILILDPSFSGGQEYSFPYRSPSLQGEFYIYEAWGSSDGRWLAYTHYNSDTDLFELYLLDLQDAFTPTPTPMPTLIAPPHGGGGGIPACPGGGGEWVWINGVPVFVCGTLLE